MCLVFGYPIQIVQDLTHAPKLIIQHLMPVVCAIDVQSIIHTLAKTGCHIYHHLQCYLVVCKGVVVQEASHNLMDLQVTIGLALNEACPEIYKSFCVEQQWQWGYVQLCHNITEKIAAKATALTT